jgi:hypothetical protein
MKTPNGDWHKRMLVSKGKIYRTMVQFDAHGRYVRRASYNPALMAIWRKQLPHGRIQLLP